MYRIYQLYGATSNKKTQKKRTNEMWKLSKLTQFLFREENGSRFEFKPNKLNKIAIFFSCRYHIRNIIFQISWKLEAVFSFSVMGWSTFITNSLEFPMIWLESFYYETHWHSGELVYWRDIDFIFFFIFGILWIMDCIYNLSGIWFNFANHLKFFLFFKFEFSICKRNTTHLYLMFQVGI